MHNRSCRYGRLLMANGQSLLYLNELPLSLGLVGSFRAGGS